MYIQCLIDHIWRTLPNDHKVADHSSDRGVVTESAGCDNDI